MAIGDGTDATAAGMAVVLGTQLANTIDTLITASRDYIANGPMYWKPGVQPCSIAQGGTGASNPPAARTALGITPANISAVAQAGGNIRIRWDQPTLNFVPSINSTETSPLARHDQVDSKISAAVAGIDLSSRVAKAGDTMSGHLYLPNSVAATSGYVVAYINGDGRVSRGASTERVKKFISPIAPSILGDLFPQLFRFQMRTGDGSWRFGYIAERLAESEALRPFVVWETEDDGKTLALDDAGQPIPLSIDFIGLLIAQVSQLHVRVLALEAKAAS